MNDVILSREMAQYADSKLRENLNQLRRCASLLTEEQLWQRPNEISNSVGNLLLHLQGNVRQWIVAGIGGDAFDRDRPAEFGQRDPLATDAVLKPLEQTVARACEIILGLNADRLAASYQVQGYDVTGLAVVFHVVEHFSFHTGQIIYWTKVLTGHDLSLYDPQGHRLDGRTAGVP